MECLSNFGISLLASLIITAFWSIILYRLRPKLKVQEIYFNNSKLNVRLINECIAAINIRMEICTIQGDATHHLDIDKSDFIILPKGDNRVFKASISPEIEDKIRNNTVNIRVRFYGVHSYSGFGKAFEEKFKYQPEQFVRL